MTAKKEKKPSSSAKGSLSRKAGTLRRPSAVVRKSASKSIAARASRPRAKRVASRDVSPAASAAPTESIEQMFVSAPVADATAPALIEFPERGHVAEYPIDFSDVLSELRNANVAEGAATRAHDQLSWKERHVSPFRAVAAFFSFAMAVIAVGGFVISGVNAATFVTPTQSAPNGNIPGIIWNRLSALATQTGASIDIDGGISAQGMNTFGVNTLALTGTQNLVYGNVLSGTANTSLLLLQTNNVERLRVDTSGNVTAAGRMKANGCFGRTYVGRTATAVMPASIGSYAAADARCASAFPATATLPAARVCRDDEILESVACGVSGDPIKSENGTSYWINGGPPGFTAYATDCDSWTSNAVNRYGRVWTFDNSPTGSGGRGSLANCSTPGSGGTGLYHACCR